MLKLLIKVMPHAKMQKVEELLSGNLQVRLCSPPEKGKANQELVTLLAKRLGLSKSSIKIQRGITARLKIVEIDTDDDYKQVVKRLIAKS